MKTDEHTPNTRMKTDEQIAIDDKDIRNLVFLVTGLMASGHYTELDEDGDPQIKRFKNNSMAFEHAIDLLDEIEEVFKIKDK